ncbi:MAG: hypothetical protein SGCHY_005489 [Lobulomycetales sp.]
MATKHFDLLIIGGGATGGVSVCCANETRTAGCALDAATRGLSTVLVEQDDFASGTSSRSTKLVHGGVRYLEKAFLEQDYEQYKLVKEALFERSVFLKTAPYLSYQLPIMLPIYKYWKVPYYYAGSKAYDLLAGGEGLSSSYFLSAQRAVEAFPMLSSKGLVGAMVYYDGAHNDSRMNVAIARTAECHGATVLNHAKVVDLVKDKAGKICAAMVKDRFTGEIVKVKARGVINATGPFCDAIRKMDDPAVENIVSPSAGTHLILPGFFSPRRMGLIDPSTSDGRVIFFLPWEGNTIAGTTDVPLTEVIADPVPTEPEIQWILKEVENYLSPDIKVRRGDVLAAWSGIRPLVRDPSATNTAELVRSHMMNVSESGLLTIAGGKWTTYRAMAMDAIDLAVKSFNLSPSGPCVTENTRLVGTHEWSPQLFVKLIQHFGLETDVAQHLSNSYGDCAFEVASLATMSGERWPVFGKRLVSYYPYIDAEVRYAFDVLARRTRLAFLNAYAALDALPRVISIMKDELSWSEERCKQEYADTVVFLKTMGLMLEGRTGGDVSPTGELSSFFSRNHFLPHEMEDHKTAFQKLDIEGRGKISRAAFEQIFTKLGIKLQQQELDDVFAKCGIKGRKADRLSFPQYLDVLGAIKELKSRQNFSNIVSDQNRDNLVDRSGGGV